MLIKPNWPAPKNVQAFTTTREGGVSEAGYASLDLAAHVGDNPQHVLENRRILREYAKLPAEPLWLQQIHSDIVIAAEHWSQDIVADAIVARAANQVCVVMTADCLPILLCDQQGTVVAAIHAGWRGLANGVIANTLAAMQCPGEAILAWFGPAIGSQAFEVGPEVRQQFLELTTDNDVAFTQHKPNYYLADLYQLARIQLQQLGVNAVFGGEYCTYSDPALFYSYRRDGRESGRMVTLIWLNTGL